MARMSVKNPGLLLRSEDGLAPTAQVAQGRSGPVMGTLIIFAQFVQVREASHGVTSLSLEVCAVHVVGAGEEEKSTTVTSYQKKTCLCYFFWVLQVLSYLKRCSKSQKTELVACVLSCKNGGSAVASERSRHTFCSRPFCIRSYSNRSNWTSRPMHVVSFYFSDTTAAWNLNYGDVHPTHDVIPDLGEQRRSFYPDCKLISWMSKFGRDYYT